MIHRAFHALPPLNSPDGKPTNALYGVSSILLKIMREEKPEYAAALFDRAEPTFRAKNYAEYKAKRPKLADELVPQLIESHELFNRFGVRTFDEAGLEADDLIATMAERFRKESDLKIIILTGDLDTLQLVEDDHVYVRTFRRGISDTLIYDEAAVKERYGLRPDQLTDYKGLVGDQSDNIKGVPGVGPKTAQAIIAEYGTLDNALKHKEDKKIAEKILPFENQARLSKELVVLRRDADIGGLELGDLEVRTDKEDLSFYFSVLGFETLSKRLNENGGGGKKEEKGKPGPTQGKIF